MLPDGASPTRRMPIATIEPFGVRVAVDLEAHDARDPRGVLEVRPQPAADPAPDGVRRHEEMPDVGA